MFTLIDASRLILATLLGGVTIALPGVALARAFGLASRDSLVAGLAVLPLLDSLLARLVGLDAATAATLALAVAGAALLVRAGAGRPSAAALAIVAAWVAIVVVQWVDFDVAGRLYQPFTVIDTVKHAATTQAIVDTGVPPRDPFFLREQRVSYYYFFYMLPALVERLGFGLVDARAAVGGCVVWVGLGLYGLVQLALERAGIAATARRRALVVLLLAAAGLDIVGVLFLGLVAGVWIADPGTWNEQIAGWFESVVWVPHHVVALISSMLGLMALATSIAARGEATTSVAPASWFPRWRGIGLAAACFASTLGLSVWIALVLVVTVALWGLVLLAERRWRALGALAIAGAASLVLAAPQIHDLVVGRAGGAAAAAIVPTVRAFSLVDGVWPEGASRLVARFVALPLNYFFGFGVFAVGTLLFWRMRGRADGRTEFARVLGLAAIAGLVLGAFLKSTLFNNDLGWRVVLFPMLAGTVWTVAALEQRPGAWRTSPLLAACLVLGWVTTAYAIVGLRAYPRLLNLPQAAFLSAEPAVEHDLRVAYGWADAHLPASAVLQHDPARPRAFAFALYGRHPVAVSDFYGSLFGADPHEVDQRIAALAPIFASTLPPADVRARARAAGIDDLVVTAANPVWRDRTSFVWRAAPAYASARVRIVPVSAIAALEAPSPQPARAAAASEPGHGG